MFVGAHAQNSDRGRSSSVRKVFRDLLQERREFVVVGDAADGLEAIAQARALRPDVILMDISMPNLDGIEATRRLRAELPFIQILGLSSQLWPEPMHPIEEAGAAGYFVKGVDTQRLIDHMLQHPRRSGCRGVGSAGVGIALAGRLSVVHYRRSKSASTRRSGETGRRAGLKIPWGSPPVWVRFPPPALCFQ